MSDLKIFYVVPEGYNLPYGKMSKQTIDDWPVTIGNKPCLDVNNRFYLPGLGANDTRQEFPIEVIDDDPCMPKNTIYLLQRDKDIYAPKCGYTTIRDKKESSC
jgi:hypothetical protein